MNNSELTAYNYGRRLAQDAVTSIAEGREGQFLAACTITPDEQAALDRLGKDRWWRFVLQGGNEIIGEPDVVPPLQT